MQLSVLLVRRSVTSSYADRWPFLNRRQPRRRLAWRLFSLALSPTVHSDNPPLPAAGRRRRRIQKPDAGIDGDNAQLM